MIAANVEHIRGRIAAACARAGRRPDDVTLVAVSKTFSSNHIREAVGAGVFDLGENFVQELTRKRDEVGDDRIRWHFVGHLQTNKVKAVAGWIHLIHSVDSLHLGKEISKHAQHVGRRIDVLVEVNASAEATKFGVRPDEALGLIEQLVRLPSLAVRGLMTIGPLPATTTADWSGNLEDSRRAFGLLRQIKERMEEKGIALHDLSMGMTNDFEVAVEEGATIVRIGTGIFGEREKR